MKKEEYLILKKAITYYRTLREVSLEDKVQSEEVAKAATKLFTEGDILAEVMGENKAEPPYEDYEWYQDIILSPEDVIANLNGDLTAYYYLTPQGGAKWEAVSNPNWNLFYLEKIYFNPDVANLEGINKSILEKWLNFSDFLSSVMPVSGSEEWEVIEPWKATYWKILQKAWRVTYKHISHEDFYQGRIRANEDWVKADQEAGIWYSQISHWYTDPQFD